MNELFKGILDAIHSFVPSYGWSMILFTILIRLLITPLDYRSRASMRKITKLAPKQAELQKKYGKDPDKLQRKQMELYQKEHVSPMASCLPMLLSMIIIWPMFTSMRMAANEQLARQAFDIILTGQPTLEPFFWIKNIWMADSPFNSAWPTFDSLRLIPTNEWLVMFNALSEEARSALAASVNPFMAEGVVLNAAAFGKDYLTGTISAIGQAMQAVPGYAEQVATIPGLSLNLLITQLSVCANMNGWFLLPIAAAVFQYIMNTLTPSSPAPSGDAAQQQSSGAMMKWFFPLFMLFIAASSNAAFSLYLMASNVIAMVENFIINWYLDKKDAQAAALPAADNGQLK